MFVLKDDCNDSRFLSDFDSTFPNHIGPTIKEVALSSIERRKFEDGDSFCFMAEDKLRWFHLFKFSI